MTAGPSQTSSPASGGLSILYLGQARPYQTVTDRAQALSRLGHRVLHIDPDNFRRGGRLLEALHYRTGYRLVRRSAAREVLRAVRGLTFDVVWVDGGKEVSGDLLKKLRPRSRALVNYMIDDPYGGRDMRRWDTHLASVSEYDLLVVVRTPNVAEAYARGARRVMRVFRGYDEVSHAPRTLTDALRAKWATEVVFVGTWLPERGPFLAELLRRGVPLSIWGARWQKAPEWPAIREAWRGPHLRGDDYAYALQSAKVCLGLLSKANRDEHTTRSLEIPALGALFCAERTPQHESLFRDGEEAVFWSDAADCAAKCRELLADDGRRAMIAEAGHRRVLQLGLGNEETCARILGELDSVLQPEVASHASGIGRGARDEVDSQ